MDSKVDLIGGGKGQGEVATRFLGGGLDPGRMRPFLEEDGRSYVTVCVNQAKASGLMQRLGIARSSKDSGSMESIRKDLLSCYQSVPINTNATLRRDEWKQLDDVVQKISETRLGGVQDLIDNNLVFSLGNAMGTTVLEYHDISDALEADLTMDGVSRARGDRPSYGTNYLPIPIIHADYELNSRVLEASRKLGNPLDTSLAERAARKVSEKLENMLFTNTTYVFGGGTIYSYLNHPNRNLKTLSEAWDAAGKTGEEILTDVLAMKQASITKKHYGPWMLYIPTAYETQLDEDYNTTRGNSVRQRILEIAGVKGIKVIDTLPANTVLLVQMTSDVVRLVSGMGIQNVEWQTEGRMVTKYKVMTIQVPQVRADQDGNSGIVHLS